MKGWRERAGRGGGRKSRKARVAAAWGVRGPEGVRSETGLAGNVGSARTSGAPLRGWGALSPAQRSVDVC